MEMVTMHEDTAIRNFQCIAFKNTLNLQQTASFAISNAGIRRPRNKRNQKRETLFGVRLDLLLPQVLGRQCPPTIMYVTTWYDIFYFRKMSSSSTYQGFKLKY